MNKQHHQQLAAVEGGITTVLPTIETQTDAMNHSLVSPTSQYHPSQDGFLRRRRWLVVDFDGTCTEHDTTPLLPRLAAFATRQRSSVVSESSETEGNKNSNNSSVAINQLHMQDLERRMRQFQQLEEEYIRRYDEAKSSLFGAKNGGDLHLQHQSIYEMLDALDEPSTIVTQMVSESRVLEGLGQVDAEELGGILQLHTELTDTAVDELELSELEGECMGSNDGNIKQGELEKVVVRLRPGCQRTLSRILSENCSYPDTHRNEHEPPLCWGWNVAVLSINWCPALIDASIVQPVLKQRRSVLRIDTCNTEIPIWSNQVNGDGVISLHVSGALAKRDRIKELRHNIHQSSVGKNVIVYVGDSTADLAALLEADIGIIMGQITSRSSSSSSSSSSSVKSVSERWGIQIVPLRHRHQHDFGMIVSSDNFERWRQQSVLWQVEGWMEIDELLLELDGHWACDMK